jgi:hypothetical protein
MDDLYLIRESREYLKECLKTIAELCGKLKITLNAKKTRIAKLSDGVGFLKGKYRLLPSGKVLRLPCKDSTTRMKRRRRFSFPCRSRLPCQTLRRSLWSRY